MTIAGIFSGQTIAQRLAQRKITTGFDYLRLALAICVVGWHSIQLAYGQVYYESVWQSLWRPFGFAVIPMFFTLSGYLVAGSLDRVKSIFEFVLLRILRIIPALFVELLLSAFILGPILTSFSVSNYFRSPLLYSYFLNVVGEIHYYLPGMFEHNPYPNIVNAQLWTIPWELWCYASLTALAVLRITKDRRILLAVTLFATVAAMLYFSLHKHPHILFEAANGPMLVLDFLVGVCFFFWRDRIVLNRWIFAISVLLSFVLTVSYKTQYLAILPLGYITVFIGLTSPPKKWLFGGADLSYGLYLFGWPLEQACAQIFPQFREWWFILGFVMIFGMLYAGFSWTFIEKPLLGRKWQIIDAVMAAAARLRPSSKAPS